jgi:hypothetical protein
MNMDYIPVAGVLYLIAFLPFVLRTPRATLASA